jgi:hypothetical protein
MSLTCANELETLQGISDELSEIHEIENIYVVTEHGIFCSQGCADSAREGSAYKAALDDRESWYWNGREYGMSRPGNISNI